MGGWECAVKQIGGEESRWIFSAWNGPEHSAARASVTRPRSVQICESARCVFGSNVTVYSALKATLIMQ